MNFHEVTGRQYDAESSEPVKVSLREVDEATAREHLAEIEHRDSAAWKLMFDGPSRTWTAAALSDFKDLYNKLSFGRLRWVLSTGLPLHTNFGIWLNGEQVESSKASLQVIKEISVGSKHDTVATRMGLATDRHGRVALPGIGELTGVARIYEKQLTSGKSDDVGRSNGFFVRVRGRVINLEDELFGIEALNHAAWSRFALEVNADGLREHLLSSREGVRDSEDIQRFREYLRGLFNLCRSGYEAFVEKENEDLDMQKLLSDAPSAYFTDPLFHSVRKTLETGTESFYIDAPRREVDEDPSEWLAEYGTEIAKNPFDETTFEHQGPNAPALRYDPTFRKLVVNSDHPFVDKLMTGNRNRNPAKLFASSEVVLEDQLQECGIDRGTIANFLTDRDRVLRLTAGDAPPTAKELLRLLYVARHDRIALERAVGMAFRVLGFEYERKGGNAPGSDGILYARLGRQGDSLADYKLVYDAKTTGSPSVPADKVDLASLEDFRKQECADFGFFFAAAYAAETKPEGALNRRIGADENSYQRLTLLKIEHVRRLVLLHFQHGVTLTELRSLFDQTRTVTQVDDWIESFEEKLRIQGDVPLAVLLEGLEKEKKDPKAVPSVVALRAKCAALRKFQPERLTARLKAVENIVGRRWLEVEGSGEVLLHQTAEQVLKEIQRNIDDLTATNTDS